MRTSGVKLVAETDSYERNVEAAAEATEALKESVDGVGRESERTGRQVDGLGNDFRDTARDARALKGEIREVERTLAGLAVEFAAAGSAADRLDISKNMRKQQGELRQLLRVDKLLPGDEEIKPAAKHFTQSLSSAMESGLAVVPQIVGASAVAAAPLVGASIAGAVVGAAGVGGVIGGLALAARDPRVQQFGKVVGQDLLADLTKRSAVMIDPALVSLGKLRIGFQALGPDLDRVFAQSAKNVAPLVDGLISGAQKFGHGLADAIGASGPVVTQLGHTIDQLGASAGDFLSKMADHADDGAAAIRDLTSATTNFIDVAGSTVGVLADVYGVVSQVNHGFSEFTGGLSLFQSLNPVQPLIMLADGIRGVDSAQHQAASSSVAMTAGATAAAVATKVQGMRAAASAQQLRDLDKAQEEAAKSARSLYASQVDAAEATANATKTIKDNGKNLDITSAKGRANRQALIGVANAYVRVHDDTVAANGEGAKSAGVAARNQTAFEKLAVKAGYSAGQARNLARSLGLIPTRRETQIRADISQAEARVKRMKSLLAGFHGKTVSVNVIINESRIQKVQNTLDRLGGRARGGPVEAGTPYIVGEERAEVFVPKVDGTIVSSMARFNSQHTAMAKGGVIREPIYGVGRSGRTYSFGEGGIPETVTPGERTYSTGGGRALVASGPTVYITNTYAAGANLVEAGRIQAEQLKAYLNAGGSVVLTNGSKVLP